MNNKFKEFEKYCNKTIRDLKDQQAINESTGNNSNYLQGQVIAIRFVFNKFQQLFKSELIVKLTMKQAMADAKVIQSCPGAFGFKNGLMKDSETQIKKDGITTGCRGGSCADCWDRVAE